LQSAIEKQIEIIQEQIKQARIKTNDYGVLCCAEALREMLVLLEMMYQTNTKLTTKSPTP
jgi:hypothetical protein